MSNIAKIVRQVAVSHDDGTVLVELICSDELAAIVLYDDILSRLNSQGGLSLWLLCGDVVAEAGKTA